MPRETVAGNDRHALQITWSRDAGYIQAATIAHDPAGALLRNLAEHRLVLIDADTRNEVGTAQLEEFAATVAGWHVDLNRADCNRLVQITRRARDQAMGRDE